MNKFILFLTAVLSIVLSACSEKSTTLDYTVTYDIQLPEPLVEVCDIQVTYYDNGLIATQQIIDGKFTKTFSYHWEDEELEKSEKEFNSLTVDCKLIASETSLSDGSKLFDDKDAHVTVRAEKTLTIIDGDNKSVSQLTEEIPFILIKEDRERELTVQQQLDYFKSLENRAYFNEIWNRTGKEFSTSYNLNIGGTPKSVDE